MIDGYLCRLFETNASGGAWQRTGAQSRGRMERKEVGIPYSDLKCSPGSSERMNKSGQRRPTLPRNGLGSLGGHPSPRPAQGSLRTGFINPPSQEAQDHLRQAKPPGRCWWARLGQVICGMGVKGSVTDHRVRAPSLPLVAQTPCLHSHVAVYPGIPCPLPQPAVAA